MTKPSKSEDVPTLPPPPDEQSVIDPATYDGVSCPAALIGYRIRPYRGESGFVVGTWVRSFEGAHGVRNVPRDEYRLCQGKLATVLVDRGTVFVAEHQQHMTLLGFVVGERAMGGTAAPGTIVHYVYVKHWARKHGIGNALLDALLKSLRPNGADHDGNVRFTHNTREPFTLMARKRGWKYSPYPAFRKGWE